MKSKRISVYLAAVVTTMLGIQNATGEAADPCASPHACIGMVIDSGDPVLIQMGHEMSKMVTGGDAGTVVKPTMGPIANVARMMSRENAGLSVVPSDMLQYTNRSDDPALRKAEQRLRFIMTIGQKAVHVIARDDIKRLEDLQGKRVVMGPDNTAIWVVSNNILYLHGVTPSEKIQLKPVAGITAVMLGEADAAFVVGNAPMGVVQRISEMRKDPELKSSAEKIHMLTLDFPIKGTGYQRATVDYPGFAENAETVAILPTLVSYDFTHKRTPYFKRRCHELMEVGQAIRSRLEELRKTGHKQWQATTWELEAGNWQKDACFFGKSTEQVVAESPARVNAATATSEWSGDLREVQQILNQLGYNAGPVDGIMGPKTSGALKKFQDEQGMQADGKMSAELLEALRAKEKMPI